MKKVKLVEKVRATEKFSYRDACLQVSTALKINTNNNISKLPVQNSHSVDSTHAHVTNPSNNFLSPKQNKFVDASVQKEVPVQFQEPVTEQNIPKINPLTKIIVQSCALIAVLLWKVMNIKEIICPTEQLSEI